MTPIGIICIAFLGYLVGRWREYSKHQYDHCPLCGGHTKIKYGYDYRYDDELVCEDCNHVVASRWHL